MTDRALTFIDLMSRDLAKDRVVVPGAVSDRLIEILPTDDARAAQALQQACDGAVVIRDGAVALADDAIRGALGQASDTLIFPDCDETLKSLDQAEKLAETLAKAAPSAAVVIGSGSLINLATYAVADLPATTQLAIIPTNAMSIADVAYGGLGLVNRATKNDTRKLRDPDTIFLSRAQFSAAPVFAQADGQIEVVKHLIFQTTGQNAAQIARLLDPNQTLTPQQMFASAALGLKLNIGLRYAIRGGMQSAASVLGFGHAHAHAIETLSNYRVSHSEAVRFGMALDCTETNARLTGLLVAKAPWPPALNETARVLAEMDTSSLLRAYQAKSISNRDILCFVPKETSFPYEVQARRVTVDRLRTLIKGLL